MVKQESTAAPALNNLEALWCDFRQFVADIQRRLDPDGVGSGELETGDVIMARPADLAEWHDDAEDMSPHAIAGAQGKADQFHRNVFAPCGIQAETKHKRLIAHR
jgi:hypothetical protein